ncbi:MAG: hypothetical protein JWN48_4497 [Myxococcaceae bacterium]|nr:hypothetical protein [Myxococcaceae bacterium]
MTSGRPGGRVVAGRGLGRRSLVLGAALCLLGVGLHSLAHADTPGVPAEVLVVLGSTEGSGIDPQLEKIEALRKAPFDSFPKKTLLQRVEVRLLPGGAAEVELPNGRKLRLALLETLKDGRFRLTLSINRPGQRDYLPVMTVVAAAGDPFFVAGQKHEGGTLIIGVRAGAVRT